MKTNIILTIILISLVPFLGYSQFKVIQGSKNGNSIEKEPVKHIVVEDRVAQGNHAVLQPILFSSPNKNIRVVSVDRNNKPIQFESKQSFRSVSSNDLETVESFWNEIGQSFDMQNKDQSLAIKSSWNDKYGKKHIKVIQTYKDFPVYGAELIFHGDQSGLQKVNGDYVDLKNLKLDWIEGISDNSVKELIINEFPQSDNQMDLFKSMDIDQWTIERVWYAENFEANKMVSAAHVIFYPNIADRYEFLIDLKTNEIIKSFQSICKLHNNIGHVHSASCGDHKTDAIALPENKLIVDGPTTANATDLLGQSRLINTYDVGGTFFLIDGSKPMFNLFGSTLPDEPQGAIWTIDGNNTVPQSNNFQVSQIASSNNQWNQSREGVSAHYNAEQAYLYFEETFDRESINGSGGTIVSIINVADQDGGGLDNAFWNGAAIFYGNGRTAFKPLGRALDVAGHEMSHGVIQNTANLEYYGESGAMNESFADIFGAMIDRDDWKIGEDVVELQFFPSGALRDMENPNNGASTGDFGGGWQPDNTAQQFTGQEDNNGVHINSGIPNHAFYLYATAIGKSKAEQVFYLALTAYLTRSSQFVDLRNAVINAASDIHGAGSSEVSAAEDAFAQVGIGSGSGTSGPTDAEVNPGESFILFSDENASNLFVATADGQFIFEPLSETDHISKPSVTDDGSRIVFIDASKRMRQITIDWNTLEVNEEVIQQQTIWRNVVISKDGGRIAAILDELTNQISVFDFGLSAWNDFELFNPTFTEGIETGDVDYADAMEFDITGELLMYDAQNTINSITSGEIVYWDISFLEVWNNEAETWRLGNIEKLFSGLPEGVSIGNPTFSKNSPFIVAFDFIEESEVSIIGANIENGDIGFIESNTGLGYPSYSLEDDRIIYEVPYIQNGNLAGYDISIKNLQADKINGVEGSAVGFTTFVRWPVWFGNGDRALTNVIENDANADWSLYPNPSTDVLVVASDKHNFSEAKLELINLSGQVLKTQTMKEGTNYITISDLLPGSYFARITVDKSVITERIVKL